MKMKPMKLETDSAIAEIVLTVMPVSKYSTAERAEVLLTHIKYLENQRDQFSSCKLKGE